MDPDSHDISSEDQAAADTAAEEAFAASFGADDAPPPAAPQSTEPPAPAPAPAPAPSPSAPAPKPEATPANPTDPAIDPYAGLSPAVRDKLAMVDDVLHKFDSLNGRYVALQREVQALRAPPPAPAAPAAAPAPAAPSPKAKRDALRVELAEVAESQDEQDEAWERRMSALEQRLAPAPAPAPAAAADPAAAPAAGAVELTKDEKELTELHPDWFSKLGSTDFALWLPTQPPAYAERVRSANSAAVILHALTKFDGYQAALKAQHDADEAEATRKRTGRSNRVSAAAQAPRGAPRPAATSNNEDPQAAFEQGFADG